MARDHRWAGRFVVIRPAHPTKMSEATDMLGYGLDVLLDQHGVTFTVAGVDGSFTGIAESPMWGTTLTDAGMREEASLSLTFAMDAGWTPDTGARVTAKGKDWVVTSYNVENASYVCNLIGRHQ